MREPAADDVLTAADLLHLERIAPDRLRSVRNQDNRAGMIFGGQPLCHAIAAARTTVAAWPAHSLSALFMRGGIVAEPVDYAVERLRDGRRFAARRVTASQRGRAIFEALVSFHDPETGLVHAAADLAGVPGPDALPPWTELVRAHADLVPPGLVASVMRGFPVEIRMVDAEAVLRPAAGPHRRDYWVRMPTARGIADPGAQAALLAFASDYWLAGTVTAGHARAAGERPPMPASLDHSLWFHAPADVSDWLLFRTDSPWAGEGRGLARATIHDRSGRLIATAAQEISLR